MAYSGDEPGLPGAQPGDARTSARCSPGSPCRCGSGIGTDAAASFSGWNIDDIEVDGITNTPFPQPVPEPSTCTARKASVDESHVVATQAAPATSLRAVDAAVCILNDTP